MSKLKQFFKPINNETIHPYVEDFRQKNIPKRYNQIKLVNYLLDVELDHYISIINHYDRKLFNYVVFLMKYLIDEEHYNYIRISNCSDGKLYYYVDFLIKFAIYYDIGLMYIERQHTVQHLSQTLKQKIIDTRSNDYNPRDFIFINNEFYK